MVAEDKDKAYEGNVRVAPVGVEGLQLWAKDSKGKWYDINVTGWGPPEGFAINPELVTHVYVIATEAFEGNVTLKLVDVTGDYGAEDNIIISQEVAVKAVVAPEVVFEFNGFEDFVAGEEKSFSVKVTATGIDDSTALKYKATFKKGDTPVANQEIWYEEGAQGNWKTFKTDENGVAYFGPKDGFTMADLDLSEGVETGFKATIAEAGEYTLTVELINAKTYATIDEAGVQLVANFAAVELDLSPIDVAIAAAEAAKEGVVVSEDGADVPAGTYWVTQEDMDALDAAIAAAEAARETAETQEDVDDAVAELEAAIAAFNAAKQEAIDEEEIEESGQGEEPAEGEKPEEDVEPVEGEELEELEE